MTTFTKAWLRVVSRGRREDIPRLDKTVADLAAFASAQTERAERAEAERDQARRELEEAEEVLRSINGDIYSDRGFWDYASWENCDAVLRARERGK